MVTEHDPEEASIEVARLVPRAVRQLVPSKRPTIPRPNLFEGEGRDGPGNELVVANEPNEYKPDMLISLALEDDQHLDVNAWEHWLAAFPALAKHCNVQSLFKSHSTTLLLWLPAVIWDLLPDDPACSFAMFIRSNNPTIPLFQRERESKRPQPRLMCLWNCSSYNKPDYPREPGQAARNKVCG